MSEKRIALTQQESEEIKGKYPSLCYDCVNGRRPAGDSNTRKGYVGCTLHVDSDIGYMKIGERKDLGEGWVDLKAHPHGKGSGVITNMQLITKGVKVCKEYSKKD